jgi:hypothetical protein
MTNKWMPEIYYEESNSGITTGLPFIKVPEDKSMPGCLFMCEVRDLKSEEVEKEIAIHSYANMTLLKNKLNDKEYDNVRKVLGLLPLKKATKKGEKINKKINKSIDVN